MTDLVNFIFAFQLQSWAGIQALLAILIGNKIGQCRKIQGRRGKYVLDNPARLTSMRL